MNDHEFEELHCIKPSEGKKRSNFVLLVSATCVKFHCNKFRWSWPKQRPEQMIIQTWMWTLPYIHWSTWFWSRHLVGAWLEADFSLKWLKCEVKSSWVRNSVATSTSSTSSTTTTRATTMAATRRRATRRSINKENNQQEDQSTRRSINKKIKQLEDQSTRRSINKKNNQQEE